jgi:hypothetical protein
LPTRAVSGTSMSDDVCARAAVRATEPSSSVFVEKQEARPFRLRPAMFLDGASLDELGYEGE